MKKNNLLLLFAGCLLLISCKSRPYYQLYNATPDENLITRNNFIEYQDDNCKITYNLWSDGGNMAFQFYNKTDRHIYVNLEESFFIKNGIAHNYYKNRIFTSSVNSAVIKKESAKATKAITGLNFWNLIQTAAISGTVGKETINSSETSISFNEEKIAIIPPKTSKFFSEYNISNDKYRDCYLPLYPSKKQIKTKKFSKHDSPYVFANRITYGFVNSAPIRINNEFYVSEITNFPEKKIIEYKKDEFCGKKGGEEKKYFRDEIIMPNRFYLKYNKNSEPFEFEY